MNRPKSRNGIVRRPSPGVQTRRFIAAALLALGLACWPRPCPAQPAATNGMAATLAFAAGTLEGWVVEGENTWRIGTNPPLFTSPADPIRFVVNSYEGGERNRGVLRSPPFVIEHERQRFSIAGWDGTTNGVNDAMLNFVLLRSHPDGEILRRTHTPGGNKLTPASWQTTDLIGRRVFLEVVDANPVLRPDGGYAWIAFADYRQESAGLFTKPVRRDDLYGLRIDANSERILCRTVPFFAAPPTQRMRTTRSVQGHRETIPVGARAEALCLLGMINHGWEAGTAHWGEHPELRPKRDDQLYVGANIGEIEICYAGGARDRVPLVIGATAWFAGFWGYSQFSDVRVLPREPFASRPEYMAVLQRALRLRQSEEPGSAENAHALYFLTVKPRPQKIEAIVVHDNPANRGQPLVTAITLVGAKPATNLLHFGTCRLEAADLAPAFSTARPGDWSRDLAALARVLYTRDADLPRKVAPVEVPADFKAARIRFRGGPLADMLSNIWLANLYQISQKFERGSGFFHETETNSPWYGSYSGIGTWAHLGVYAPYAYSRCSDHFASLALRCIDDPVRVASYMDFVDYWFYWHRDNHDPDQGPPNDVLDVARYPKGVTGHWSFGLPPGLPPWQLNEIPGVEEMDGHGATMVARWLAWRVLGARTDQWLTGARDNVFGKSRWDTTRDAAEFVCWLMDHTGMDVIYCEGETTGWAGGPQVPLTGAPDWWQETDPVKLRKNYANANAYEVYPTYVCLTALRCSAQIADALPDAALAAKWRRYADRLESGMLRLLAVGEFGSLTWRLSRHSVYPSGQDSLVQAWFAFYFDGLDPNRLPPQATGITRNTLRRQLSLPCGRAPALAMGYGLGWLCKAALVLDEMDEAGPMLLNIARYTYDKNMDYADPSRGIDWRRFAWIVPEGANILPDGSWHRIGDLSNGANQGPPLHAMEICAGFDDTKPNDLRLLPRVPNPLTGIEVEDFMVLVPDGAGLARAKVSYAYNRAAASFRLRSDRPLPRLALRLGPFHAAEARRAAQTLKSSAKTDVRTESSGTFQAQAAWWVWLENLKDIASLDLDWKS
ncbi:MAG: hypothetical protein QM840_12090 [Verrucomicrobiota bacterium]|nr:hypothetical protein [Verrucomicrobiota bacterium]